MSRASDIAAKLIDEFQITSPDEILLEDIAFAHGALIMFKPLYAAEGRLVCNKKYGIISINKNIPELGRKRFAASHELGHFELHRQKETIFVCTEQDFIDWHKERPEETEANEFAVELLMPSKLFSSEIALQNGEHVEKVKHLASRFRTSLTSTALRYIDFVDVPMMLICSKEGIIDWFKPHKNFPYKFVQKGEQVSKNTAAYVCFNKGEPPKNTTTILSKAWFNDDYNVKQDRYFNEACIYLNSYQTVLSLIWEYNIPI